ncbi:MAG: energy transducer TonB, partial [Burkholderiaceae bacterium]
MKRVLDGFKLIEIDLQRERIMDFYTTPHKPKSKLPSLAFAVGAHAVMLWLAMQAVQIIHHEDKNPLEFVDVIDKPEPIKPLDPEIKLPKDVLTPPSVFVEPPLVAVEPTVVSPITDVNNVRPEKHDFSVSESHGGGTGTTVVPHTPVHIAAVVDARACDKPEYPTRSLALGEEGVVHLAMLIGPEGQVLESRIEKSSGSKALDRAAVAGLSLC